MAVEDKSASHLAVQGRQTRFLSLQHSLCSGVPDWGRCEPLLNGCWPRCGQLHSLGHNERLLQVMIGISNC